MLSLSNSYNKNVLLFNPELNTITKLLGQSWSIPTILKKIRNTRMNNIRIILIGKISDQNRIRYSLNWVIDSFEKKTLKNILHKHSSMSEAREEFLICLPEQSLGGQEEFRI